MVLGESDLFGDSDPRDPSGKKAHPGLDVPEQTAKLSIGPESQRQTLLVQPDLFELAESGDCITYRGFQAIYQVGGSWVVLLPSREYSHSIDLGIYRFGAIAQFGRILDRQFHERQWPSDQISESDSCLSADSDSERRADTARPRVDTLAG